MDLNRTLAELADQNPDAVFFDNLEEALIGFGSVGGGDVRAVYSQSKIYDKLTKDGFDEFEMEAYFAQLISQRNGDNTPIIVHDFME